MTTENNLPEDAAGAPEPTAAELNPEIKIAELEGRLAEMSDAYLRAKAEAENVRRRAEEDISKARKFAVEAFAESHAADHGQPGRRDRHAQCQCRDRARRRARHAPAALQRAGAQQGGRDQPRPGAKFDPHQHQAISVVPAPTQDANTVVMVLQKGFLIADRVLRPALVTVAAPKEYTCGRPLKRRKLSTTRTHSTDPQEHPHGKDHRH